MPTYFQNDTASDLSPSWANTTQFDDELVDTDVFATFTELVSLSTSEIKSASFISTSDLPNSDDWEDGGTWTTQIATNSGGAMNIRGRVRAVRLTSTGTIDQSGSFTGYQTFSSGNTDFTFSPVAPTWSTTEACSHRLAFEYEFENLDDMMSTSHTFNVGGSITGLESTTDITENGGTCPAPASFTPKCVMF